ncbi:hypothetical protein [Thaumasiovibrio subtropicus]|uniref:hypothetical protein n=1 Tax=Thaumasiovibrio subtropicus TaxID=1891207 RepID=UPI000B356934|nr:hypothetical protein [Thaumasiovibrio subtropicus]
MYGNKQHCHSKPLRNKQRGITVVEYAVVGLSMAVIVALMMSNNNLLDAFNNAMNQVNAYINAAN